MLRKFYAFHVRYTEGGQLKEVQGVVALPDSADVSSYLWVNYPTAGAITVVTVGEEGVTFPLRFGA